MQQVQQHHHLSQRRACTALGWSRSSARYRPHADKQARDQALTEAVHRVVRRHPRFGYRRVHAVLCREARAQQRTERLNHKRVYRVWRAAGLSVPRRRPRKRRPGTVLTTRMEAAMQPNQVWCYDFVHDACANGTTLKVLTIEDEWTRESLAIEVGTSLPAARVVAVLAQLFAARGTPAKLRSDNGPEFVAQQIKRYLAQAQVRTHYIEPGKPWQNGIAESFHGKFRDECLSQEWFLNLADARRVVARYQRYYNEERPHSSLGYLTPLEFRRAYEAQQQAGNPNP